MKVALSIFIIALSLLGCKTKGQQSAKQSQSFLNSNLSLEEEANYRAELISLEVMYETKYMNFHNLPHFVSFIDSTKSFDSGELKAFFISDLIDNPQIWQNHNYQIEKTILRDIREEYEKNHPESIFQPIVNKAIANYYITDRSYEIPFFIAHDINQDDVFLSDFKDKVIVLDFWATWCGPCLSQQPYLNKLANEMVNENVVFIKVSIDENIESWENSIMEKEDSTILEWHIPVQNIDKVKSKLSITGLPRYMTLNKGNIVSVDKMPKPESDVFKEIIIAIINEHAADNKVR